ncbi:MAG: gliding motility-associated C-terminal domain-containing protein [Bacteroidetes bacterium]|nr:gliding motility-associated C-terminal domain-containing protein [Bacteroidota bacterium]
MKKRALLLFIFFVFVFKINAQNTLPYSQDNFCFDEFIKVNPSALNNARNLVVSKLTLNGPQKDVIVTDLGNDIIKFYSFINASGSFSFQALLTVPGGFGTGQQQSIDVGFFNSDALPDLVFTTDNFIYIFTNNGNYNFSLSQQISIITPFIGKPHFLKVDNIDNSGFDDFYFISSDGIGITVMPFSNTGSSFFQTGSQNVFISASYLPAANLDISLGNIQGDPDGLKDMMLTYDQVADSVVFVENTSLPANLSFNYYQSYLSPTPQASPDFYIKKAEIADINADGKLDFVFIGNGTFGDRIKVYAGLNSFNLSFHVDIPTVCDFSDFKIGHINGDSNIDFVGTGSVFGFSGIVVYPGNGNNLSYFNPSTTISLPLVSHPDELQLEDVDANGMNDIIFKPWRSNQDNTYMIPNFSSNVYASVTPSVNCGANPSTFAVTTLSTFTSTLNYNWEYIPTGSIVATTAAFNSTVAGQYKAHVDFNMYSSNTCTLRSDTINLISNTPTIGVASQNIKVCYSHTATTTASGAATYTWFAPSSTIVSTTQTLSVQGLSNVTYTVVGELTNGCKGTNTVNVSLFPLNTDNILASKNPACLGDAITLSLPAVASYTWNNTSFAPLFVVSPTVATTYSLDFIDTLGCKSSKIITINVDVDCKPKIYTGVTINGDNNNNVFTIDNIENFTNNTVTIYNRWGKEIFTTPKYDNKTNYWPTPEHLRTLTPSTYFFVVNFGDGSALQKGWVELISN